MTERIAKTVILVVDDEPLLRMDVEDCLLEWGYEVITAGNADEAVHLLRNRPEISLVVTDINMPGSMNGIALMKTIRERWPPVKVIIVSSHTTFIPGEIPDDVPVLGKPVVFDELLLKAEVLLGAG